MNCRAHIDRIYLSSRRHFSRYICTVISCLATSQVNADTNNTWISTITPQAYFQSYNGTTTRDNSYNAGAYVMGNYLDSSTVIAGYNFTLVNLGNSASITEHLFYASGRHNLFPDALPGKMTLRLDLYGGNSTFEYRVSNPPTGMKKRNTMSTSNLAQQSTSVSVLQPIVSFINYNKTLYFDLGYARSNYTRDPDATVNQLTPTAAIGWNESYDWLQLRAYLINVDESNGVYNDDHYNSQELTYTHWFSDGATPRPDFARIAVLTGERILAVDPDAAVVHSTGDKQTGSVTISVQWKTSDSNRILALVSSNKYENDIAADKYTGLLFYINVQHQR